MVSTGVKPYFDIDYDDNSGFSSPTALEADLVNFTITLNDLKLGLSTFELVINNYQGKWDATFPAVPDADESITAEAGLHDFIKFQINGKVIGIFRIEDIDPNVREDGTETLVFSGGCLGHELLRREAVSHTYLNETPETIITHFLTNAHSAYAIADVDLAPTVKDASPTRLLYKVPDTAKKSVKECILDIAEEAGYDIFVDPDQHKAVVRCIETGHADVKLNTHLYFNKRKSTNNVTSASQPRRIRGIKNYLTYERNGKISSSIPSQGFLFTEVLEGADGTAWWTVTGGGATCVVTLDYENKNSSSAIACIHAGPKTPIHRIGAQPKPKLTFSNTDLGSNLDISSTGFDLNKLEFDCKIGPTSSVNVTITITDNATPTAHTATYTWAPTTSWAETSVAIGGDWAGWGADGGDGTGDMTDTLVDIEFASSGATNDIYIEGLRFTDDPATINGVDYTDVQTYMVDTTSRDAYGRREQELKLPFHYNFIRMDLYTQRKLNLFKNPIRVISLTTPGSTNYIDPATVVEDDGSTAAPLQPGYSIQFEADRWHIPDASDGDGTWWRILKVVWHGVEGGLTCDLDITPAGTEGASSEDYTYLYPRRYNTLENLYKALYDNLTRHVKDVDRTTQESYSAVETTSFQAHEHSSSDGSGMINTDLGIQLNASSLALDADDDTGFVAGTDDQLEVVIATATDFHWTANQFNILSGSSIIGGSFSSPITYTTAGGDTCIHIHTQHITNALTGTHRGIRLRSSVGVDSASGTLYTGVFQGANANGIDVSNITTLLVEAIGKSDTTSATITTMRAGLFNTEWNAKDTVTSLYTLHVRTHTRNASGEGAFGTGYLLYLENEAVGGNGQALDAMIYLKETNLSGGNLAADYGIDMTGVTSGFTNAAIAIPSDDKIQLRDNAIYISSKDDGHLDLDADTSIDLNAAVDMAEISPPSAPGANSLRLYTEDIQGFSFFSFVDSGGMRRKLVRDSMLLVKNVRGTTIAANRIVYTTGSSDNVPTVDLAKADSTSTMPAIGVTIESIADGAFGRVIQVGLLENVNTNAFNEGDVLYVSDSTEGTPTSTLPVTPSLTQEIGTVLVKSATVGAIQIISRGLTGDEYGTIQNDFYIGDGLAGSKVLHFNATSDATVTWDETDLNFTIPLKSSSTSTRLIFGDKNGAADATNFSFDPAAGSGMEGFVYDYSNGRLYWYGNGGVHYVTQTAGLEFGANHSSCLRCQEQFKVNDEIKMVVDKIAKDGSPHVIPVHSKCRNS